MRAEEALIHGSCAYRYRGKEGISHLSDHMQSSSERVSCTTSSVHKGMCVHADSHAPAHTEPEEDFNRVVSITIGSKRLSNKPTQTVNKLGGQKEPGAMPLGLQFKRHITVSKSRQQVYHIAIVIYVVELLINNFLSCLSQRSITL